MLLIVVKSHPLRGPADDSTTQVSNRGDPNVNTYYEQMADCHTIVDISSKAKIHYVMNKHKMQDFEIGNWL